MFPTMNPFLTHGAVSWSEYLAADPAVSIAFYENVLGWQHHAMPMEGSGLYHIATANGTFAAGFMQRPHESIPPCWGFYVTVEDIQAFIARHKPRLCVPLTDTPMGPFCGILDPQGAVLYAIEYNAAENETEAVTDFVSAFTRHGLFSWFELHTKDAAAAAQYYGTLFGWTFDEMPIPSGIYRRISVGDVGIGGIAEMPLGDAPAYWHGFVTVDDVDARIDKATARGAEVKMGPFDLPGVGRMAHIHDPDGAPLSLITYEPMVG